MRILLGRVLWSFWLIWIVVSFSVCLFRPLFKEWPPFFTPEWISITAHPLEAPNSSHFWGTDELGRDVLIRLIFGTGYSLAFAIGVSILTSLIGLWAGLVLSFLPARWKAFAALLVEVVSTLPLLPLIFIALAIYPGQIFLVGLLKAFLGWGPLAQLTRAESEVLKSQLWFTAAHSQGLSLGRILTKYFLPHLCFVALSFFPLLVFSSLFTLSSLDYFGLGFPIPIPNLAEGFRQFHDSPEAWWLFAFPLLVLSSLLLGLHSLGKRRR